MWVFIEMFVLFKSLQAAIAGDVCLYINHVLTTQYICKEFRFTHFSE